MNKQECHQIVERARTITLEWDRVFSVADAIDAGDKYFTIDDLANLLRYQAGYMFADGFCPTELAECLAWYNANRLIVV